MSKIDLFLKKVRVKEFAESSKIGLERKLTKTPNENQDHIYTVVGVTALNEGTSEYDGEYGYYFSMKNRHKVYLVAKSIGRRFKVLEEDMEVLGGETE